MIPAFSPLTGLSSMVKTLFSAGEQGAWYDPSDLSTLYQDAAGTIPVTAVGQPVGLMLDKSKGLVLGAELVTNGTFDTNINGWTSNQGQIPLWSAGRLRLSTQKSLGTSVLQAVSCVIGKSYALNVSYMTVSGDGLGPGLRISTSGVDFGASGQIYRSPYEFPTAFVNHTAVFTATQSTIYVYLIASGGSAITTTYEFDNISVRELPGNHATQTTTASRPTRQIDTSGNYYLSFDGIDDSLVTGNINFTATDKMTVFAGVRKLSDAASGIVAELSSNVGGNNQSFALFAPGSNGANHLRWVPEAGKDINSPNQYPAPISTVLAGVGKKAGIGEFRVNGVSVGAGFVQIAGNYGNFPLYIGRRGGTSLPFSGRLYGLIVRGAATDDLHLTHAEKYLAYKSGVSL